MLGNSMLCYTRLRKLLQIPKSKNAKKQWGEWEATDDKQILDKNPFMVSMRHFGFVTE